MSQADAHVRRRNVARYAALVALFMYALSVFVPWRPSLPQSELDDSWAMMLHWARLHGLQFGRDLVFTYGPWGFVMTGFHAATYTQVIIVWSLYSFVFVWALFVLAQRLGGRCACSALWMIAVIALCGVTIHFIQDLRLYLLCCAFVLVHFYIDRGARNALKIALVVAMAMASLAKFSIAFMAVAVLLVVSVEQLLRRRAPWFILFYVAAIVTGWLAANQRLANLPAFISTSLEISRSYGSAEAIFTPTETLDVSIFVLLAATLHAVVGMAHWPDKRSVLLTQSALGVMLFLLFKVGYVRHDGHELIALLGVAIFALLYGAALWPRIRGRAPRIVLVILLAASLSATWYKAVLWEHTSLPSALWQPIPKLPERAELACTWLMGHPRATQIFESDLAKYKSSNPIPDVRTAVDAWPWNQGAIIANNLDYRPRPVPQTYLAFSTNLSMLNRDFLQGSRAPEAILLDIKAIDQHPPMLEDPMSWPELLTRYDLTDASQNLAVLTCAGTPRSYSIALISEVHVSMKQWVDVPESSDPIWATIEVNSTFTGKIVQAMYKTDPLLLKIKLRSGIDGDFRLIPAAAKGGFLLSPVINDRVAFALLNSKSWSRELGDSIISKLRLEADTGSGLSDDFEPAHTIRFFKLQYPHTDLSAVPGVGEYVGFREFLFNANVIHADAPLKLAQQKTGESVVLLPGKAQLSFPVTKGASRMTFRFGVWNSQATEDQSRGLTEFRIFAVGRDAQNHPMLTPLWQRTLDPEHTPEDRGAQKSQIDFPANPPSELLFETAGDAPPSLHSPYWSGVWVR